MEIIDQELTELRERVEKLEKKSLSEKEIILRMDKWVKDQSSGK